MKDVIVREVREAREELFARAGHDLARLVSQLQRRQSNSRRKVVKVPRRYPRAA
jgi:hypothetical protein